MKRVFLCGCALAVGCGADPSVEPGDDAAVGRDGEAPIRDAGDRPVDAGDPLADGAADDAAMPGGVLRIYWVDTEGGAATVLVAPGGEVILVDAGNAGGRDAGRISDVLRDEIGATRIDALITTHYHSDHVGGTPEVASEWEVVAFYDHGDTIETSGGARALYDDYTTAAAGRRTTVVPGDVLDFGALRVRIVSAAGELVAAPPGLPPNPHCEGTSVPTSPMDENAMSVGLVATFGAFDFLDLGDLTQSREHALACPVNRLGVVDLFQTTHHGLDISNAPELVHAVDPVAAVTNNGARKGGAASVYDTLTAGASLEALFQLHRAEKNDAAHNAEPELIANPDEAGDEGFFIAAEITADGHITLTNPRTGATRAVSSR